MKLVTTDDRRRTQMRQWWHGIASRGESPTSETPTLRMPPTPAQLFGGRDDDANSHVGCNDFDSNHTGIAQVNVYRSTSASGPFSLIGNFDIVTFNLLFDATLLDSQQYFYALTSVGDGITYMAMESPKSAVICALLAPQNIQVFPGTISADISWDYSARNPLQAWQIQYATENDFITGLVDYVKTAVGSHVQGIPFPGHDFLNSGTTYYLRIRAIDSDGCYSQWTATQFQTLNGTIISLEILNAGTGYSEDDVLTIEDGSEGSITVLTVGGSGSIATWELNGTGTGYTVGPHSVTGGTGSGASVTVTEIS